MLRIIVGKMTWGDTLFDGGTRLVFEHVVTVGLVSTSWMVTKSGALCLLDIDQLTWCVIVCVHV